MQTNTLWFFHFFSDTKITWLLDMYNAAVKTNRITTLGMPKLSELRCCFTGRFGYRCRRCGHVYGTGLSLSPSLSRSRSLSMDSRWLLGVGWGTLARSHKTALPTFFYAWILIERLRIFSMASLTWKNFGKNSTDFSSEFSCKLFFKERLSDYIFIDFENFFGNSADFSPEFSCKLFF